MDFNAFKQAVVAAAQAAGLTDYELYYESGEGTSVEVFQGEVNEFTSAVDGGVCFRCVVDGKMGYASTEALNDREAAAVVARAVENARTLESDEPVFLCEGGQTYQKLEREPYDLPSTEALIDAVKDLQKKVCAADPAVTDKSGASGAAERICIAIVNSKGLDLSYENDVVTLMTDAVVTDGREMANDYQRENGKLSDIDTDEMVQKVVKGAKDKLGGDVAPTGTWPVVFGAKAMASLLGTFAAVFSSERTQKGLSKLAGKEGALIAAPCVTLVDDPFYQDSPRPMPFDAEGSPTYKKNIIESGRLTTLFYNLKTAAVAGKQTTGNASKRGGYSAPIGISPFTLYFAPGTMTEDELVAKAGKGVYINSLGGLHAGANPISGDFSLQSAGFLIEDGKKTIPVKSFTVAGNFYELLGQMTDFSDQVELGFGSVGSPCVLVSQLSIAGK